MAVIRIEFSFHAPNGAKDDIENEGDLAESALAAAVDAVNDGRILNVDISEEEN